MEDDSILTEGEKPDNMERRKPHKKRKKLLYETIRKQVEFYFSDANLTRDRFLGKLISDDPNVPLNIFMKCNKIQGLVSSVDELAKALKESEILEVSSENLTVQRMTPIQIKNNVDECIIYVENIPPDATHEYVSKIFSEYGKVVYVSLPKFHATSTNKGFAFVEFDTPDEAAKALQEFWNKGSCLPTHMPPEKLCSIRTHETNMAPENNTCVESTKADDIILKTETKGDEESEKDTEIKCGPEESEKDTEIKCGPVEGKNSTKRLKSKGKNKTGCKTEELNEPLENVSESEGNSELPNIDKKRKLEDADAQGSDLSESEERKPKKKKIDEDKSTMDTDESTMPENGTSETKKKRKKKKKSKEVQSEVFADGLLILSKKEWKRLRNKYLDLQKQKMRQVKARLYQAQSYYHKYKNEDTSKNVKMDSKSEENAETAARDAGRVKFSPGIIVKVVFDNPMHCVPSFKSEAQTHSCVQYVDAAEGQWEAFLRCSTPSDAQSLLERQPWPKMCILEGDEENAYWDKIKKDRADKLNNKCTGNRNKERGKKKLLRKAEKMRGTHLLFD